MLALAEKNLKELWRDKKLFFFSLVSPVLLLLLSHVIFSRFSSQMEHIPIAVVNPEKEFPSAGKLFEMALQKIPSAHPNPPLFSVQESTAPKALQDFRAGKVAALLMLPRNFTETLNENKQARILLLVHEGDLRTSIVVNALQTFVEKFGFLVQKSKGETPLQLSLMNEGNPPLDSKQKSFPEICLFAFLFLIPSAASVWIGELERGSLARFRLSHFPSGKLFAGTGISLGFLGVLQILLLLATGLLLGYPVSPLLLWIWPIALLILLASYGAGLLLACCFEKEKQLNFVAPFFLVPLYVLSGSFADAFPMTKISALLPWRQSYEMLLQTMNTGMPNFSLFLRALLSSSILALLGTHLFSWKRMAHE